MKEAIWDVLKRVHQELLVMNEQVLVKNSPSIIYLINEKEYIYHLKN